MIKPSVLVRNIKLNFSRFFKLPGLCQEEFRAHLAGAKEKGYAINDAELIDDVRCVSAPLLI